jgi:uncharacterized membrane protein
MADIFPSVPDNMTGVFDLVNHAANLINSSPVFPGFFGVGILILIAVVSFIISKTFSSEKALTFSGFLTLLSAILLRFMGLISDGVLYTVVIFFTVIVIWLWKTRQEEVGV